MEAKRWEPDGTREYSSLSLANPTHHCPLAPYPYLHNLGEGRLVELVLPSGTREVPLEDVVPAGGPAILVRLVLEVGALVPVLLHEPELLLISVVELL